MKNYYLFLLLVLSSVSLAQVPVMIPISGPASRCSAPTLSLGYSTAATNSPTSYSWTVVPTVTISYNNPQAIYINFPVSAAGSPQYYTITCTASNAAGTSAPVTKTVTVYNTLTATFLGTQTICKGARTTLTVTNLFPTAAPGYTWMPNTNVLATSSSNEFLVFPTTTTNYSVHISDGICPWTSYVTITVDDCVSIHELNAGSIHFKIFPNPGSGPLHLVSTKTEDIQLINLQGELLRIIHLTEGQESLISGLSPGVYLLVAPDGLSKRFNVQTD